MPSISDVFNELTQANVRLQQLHTDLDALHTVVDQGMSQLHGDVVALTSTAALGFGQVDNTLNAGFTNMSQGLQILMQLGAITNTTLAYHTQQQHTMICLLEQIARFACQTLNEAHAQTTLQQEIGRDLGALLYISRATHSEAALAFDQRQQLQRQIEACCPPAEQPPFCVYDPCPKPPKEQAPRTPDDYRPFEPRPVDNRPPIG